MNVSQLRAVLAGTMAAMPAHADRLRELDAALGDGDLGITISAGATAVADAVAALDDSATADAVILAAAKAFMNANPSTFAALSGGGLLAASRAVKDKQSLDRDDAIAILRACIDSISRRGRSQPGDKTVLDPLTSSLDALEKVGGGDGSAGHADAAGTAGHADAAGAAVHDGGDGTAGHAHAAAALDAMIVAARAAIDETTKLASAKGRAAWLQERSAGLTDPGSVAYLLLLTELKNHWDA